MKCIRLQNMYICICSVIAIHTSKENILVYVHMCSNTHMHTHMHHACTHHTCTCTRTHTHTRTHVHMYTHTHIHVHSYTCTTIWLVCASIINRGYDFLSLALIGARYYVHSVNMYVYVCTFVSFMYDCCIQVCPIQRIHVDKCIPTKMRWICKYIFSSVN